MGAHRRDQRLVAPEPQILKRASLRAAKQSAPVTAPDIGRCGNILD